MSKVTRVPEWTGQVLNPGLSGCLSCVMGKIWPGPAYSSRFTDTNGALLGHLMWVSLAYPSGGGGPWTAQLWVPGSATPGTSWLVRECSRYIMPGKVMRSQASTTLKRSDANTLVCLSKAVFTVASSEPKGTCFHLPMRTAPSASAW